MHPILYPYINGTLLAGDVAADAVRLLRDRGRADTAEHCRRVAVEAARLARLWGVDETSAAVGGWLHDISAIVPHDDRLSVSDALGLPVLAEERVAPMLLHQKLSAAIAHEVLAVAEPSILSAIGCHTTLRAGSSNLDKIVFVADKITWDQPGAPPYIAAIRMAVEQSLDLAAYCYLDYLWQRRDTLPAMHPWAAAACHELSCSLGKRVEWEVDRS